MTWMWTNLQKTVDMFTFTKEIPDKILYFLLLFFLLFSFVFVLFLQYQFIKLK